MSERKGGLNAINLFNLLRVKYNILVFFFLIITLKTINTDKTREN